jgi:hypothetical protein
MSRNAKGENITLITRKPSGICGVWILEIKADKSGLPIVQSVMFA